MKNVDLVGRLYQAFADRDFAYIDQAVADDLEITQSSLLPWGGTYRGKDGFAAFTHRLVETVDSVVEPGDLFEAGDAVVQTGRSKGTVNATGRTFDVAEVHVLTLKDDKIVRFEAYIDTRAMLEALAE